MADKPLHVMQLTCELRPAGAERIVFELAKGLKQAGHKCTVVSIQPATGEVAGWLAAEGIEVQSLGVRSRFDFGAKARLAGLLRKRQPDLLHTHMFHANVLGRAAAAPMPKLAVVSSLHVVERRWRPWRKWMEWAKCDRADAIICVSEAVARHAERDMGLPPERLRVIYNGFDPARMEATADRSDVLLRLGVDPTSRVVGFLGRLDRQKGPDMLLRACGQFMPRVSEATVLFVGSGPMEHQLKRSTKELLYGRRIHFAGHREDVGSIMQCFEVFAFPSRWEGFGLSLLEAMAVGLPIVASRIDSVPELVEDGRSALLSDPEDHQKFGNSVLWLLNNLDRAAELGGAARKRAVERFGLESMVTKHIELYRNAVADRRGRS